MAWDHGTWNYITSTGASTHLVGGPQAARRRLLAVRFFASGVDGTVRITPRSTLESTNGAGSTGAGIVVRLGSGFDWTPAAKVSPVLVVVSSSIDVFAEVSS